MKVALAHLDAAVIEEVPLDRWRTLFDAVGWPGSLVGSREVFTHGDVLEALANDEPTDDLLRALEAIGTLGTEDGRNAIHAAMTDQRIDVTCLPSGTSAREQAVDLFVAMRGDAALLEVFDRAQVNIQQSGENRRRYCEFLGKEPKPLTGSSSRRARLQRMVEAHCGQHDLGTHVQVRTMELDGMFVFQVLRSDRTRKPLAVLPGRSARSTIEYRPVHCDSLKYDPATGRLRIAARASSMIEFYRAALGEVLVDDEDFFGGEPACSLRVLQERGGEALTAHHLPSIGHVRMTECLWERGDRDLLHLRSPDCFATIRELGLPLSEGALLQAKLKVHVAGPSARPVTVNVRVPSQIDVSNKAHESLIDRFLAEIGICRPRPTVRRPSLASLRPWRHPVSTWRLALGEAVDDLVTAGVLVPVTLASVALPDQPGAGRVLEAVSLGHPGALYGVGRMPEVAPRTLSMTDVDGLELRPDALQEFLRGVLGIKEGCRPWDDSALLDLGRLVVGDHRFRLTYVLGPLPAGVGETLVSRAQGDIPVVLAGADVTSELAKVVLDRPLPSLREVQRGIAASCNLLHAFPALATAPDGARLVVDTRRAQVWVDGVLINGLVGGTHRFKLVEALARAYPHPASSEEIARELSWARDDGTTSARQAKGEAKKAIREAMHRAGRPFDEDPFPTGPKGHYRCNLPAYIV